MTKNNGIRRFVAAGDMHFGKEWREVYGERVITTSHDLKAINAFMEFCRDFKPHSYILGGDQLNFGPISRWNRGKPRLDERFRLKDEMDLLNEHVLLPAEKLGAEELVWMGGNHDFRCQKFVDENPSLEGLIEPEKYLKLKDRNWKIYSKGQIYKIGKLYMVHGDTIKSGKYPAMRLWKKYRRNIRAFHFHLWDVYTEDSAYDEKHYHSSVIYPPMCNPDAAYMENTPSSKRQGFAYGWVAPDGSFTDHVMTIVRGKFLYNGKVYGG